MFSRSLLVIAVAVTPFVAVARAKVEKDWKEFHANPKAFMMAPPAKVRAPDRLLPFSEKDIKTGRFLKAKARSRAQQMRSGILKAEATPRVQDFIPANDLTITNGRLIENIDEMDTMNVRVAQVDVQPWSDSYWPMKQGMLGARYGSVMFKSKKRTWIGYYNLVATPGNTLADVYSRGHLVEIATLSPSEKYDLLLGVPNGEQAHGHLTSKMWNKSQYYVGENGDVEYWMGICHGWAAASMVTPRPKSTLVLTAADGKTKVPFFPSDIKGLVSYSWAYTVLQNHFIGGRCDIKNPERDKETGRVLNDECFDLNPGNFHVAVVNQVGILRRSMILDATFDYEVWNQPIYSYKYRYFNPATGIEAPNAKEARASLADFTNDKFKRFRSPKAVSFVGVIMDLTYMTETNPNHRINDSPENDKAETVTYMYDLELDGEGHIIGGEWYKDKHPDFLWKPITDVKVQTSGDLVFGQSPDKPDWNVNDAIPNFWRDIAINTAELEGLPLSAIVERLATTSNQAF